MTGVGGEIEVESAPERASIFRVTLPASAEPERPEPTATVPSASPRIRILVVDDELPFCRAVERMLGGDHEVVATADPVDALRRVEAGERFDLLLTDVVMPRLTGIELHARLLRSAPGLADRTLFLTGGATNPDVASFLTARPGKVLEKPCGAAALREAVAAVLARRSAQTVD